jgi:hypothetical protein
MEKLFPSVPYALQRDWARPRLYGGSVSARRDRARGRAGRLRGAGGRRGRQSPRGARRARRSKESVLETTIYVVAREQADLVRIWDIVSGRLGRMPSTLLGVSLLAYPDQLVEIEAVASVGDAA